MERIDVEGGEYDFLQLPDEVFQNQVSSGDILEDCPAHSGNPSHS